MFIHALLVAALHEALAVSPCEARCSCIQRASVAQATTERLARSERVALGTVVRIDTLPLTTWGVAGHMVSRQPIVARMLVRRVWRGPVTDTMTVMFRSAETRNSCELALNLGVSYVVFAYRTGGGPLATHMCTGTIEERNATETLAALGRGTGVPTRR
jgi:hypothetical protein